jgi:hypothetical protein
MVTRSQRMSLAVAAFAVLAVAASGPRAVGAAPRGVASRGVAHAPTPGPTPFSVYVAGNRFSSSEPYTAVSIFNFGEGLSAQLLYENTRVYYTSAQLAVSNRYLYVYLGSYSSVPIRAYALGSTSVAYELPYLSNGMITDSHDNLYVEVGSQILVFAPGATAPMRFLAAGLTSPGAMVVDGHDQLYVSNGSNVVVFKPGALQPFETITDGIDGADRLAIGPKYRLYVYNGGNATITAYTDGQTSPAETITQGLNGVNGIALGPTGTLYVDNVTGGNVTEYDDGGTTVSRTVTPRLRFVQWIAVDADDELYVTGQQQSGPVYVYPSKQTQFSRREYTSTAGLYGMIVGPWWHAQQYPPYPPLLEPPF